MFGVPEDNGKCAHCKAFHEKQRKEAKMANPPVPKSKSQEKRMRAQGWEPEMNFEKAREAVESLIACPPEEVVWDDACANARAAAEWLIGEVEKWEAHGDDDTETLSDDTCVRIKKAITEFDSGEYVVREPASCQCDQLREQLAATTKALDNSHNLNNALRSENEALRKEIDALRRQKEGVKDG